MNVQGGAVIPTGKSVTYADTTRAQNGTAKVALCRTTCAPARAASASCSGSAATAQNEVGSIGAQFRLGRYLHR